MVLFYLLGSDMEMKKRCSRFASTRSKVRARLRTWTQNSHSALGSFDPEGKLSLFKKYISTTLK